MYFNENFEYNGNFDETKFIVGIDLGNSDSSLSFFDFNNNKIEQLDISGGYGKAAIPTIVQYIKDTEEWVFGEYALMNKPLSDSITFDNLIDGLGKKNCYTVGKRVLEHSYILSLFIKELIGGIKNINPNAEIIGIAVTVSYLNDAAEDEILKAFFEAGYYDKLIGLYSEQESILNKYYFDENELPEKFITLDFGSRGLRGGFYNTAEKDDEIMVNVKSAFFESAIGTDKVEKNIYDIFEEYFKENTGNTEISELHKLQLEAFTYQHKDLIFKSKNSIKLYFNFVYPPFQKTIEKTDIENITLDFRAKFHDFFGNVFNRDESNISEDANFKIDKVICAGGGFEMSWIKQAVIDIFGESRFVGYKNPKCVLSQGSCAIALKYFKILKNRKNIVFSKNSAITQDIGLLFREKYGECKFIPFIEKGGFWWHKFKSKKVIINEIDGEPALEIFKKDKDDNLILISRAILDDLPKRPKGTNCFDILFEYVEQNKIKVRILDVGFGEFFEKTDYEKNIFIELE